MRILADRDGIGAINRLIDSTLKLNGIKDLELVEEIRNSTQAITIEQREPEADEVGEEETDD